MLIVSIISLIVGLANLYCMIVFVLPRTEMLNPKVDAFGEIPEANSGDDNDAASSTPQVDEN